MNTHTDKSQENKGQSVANAVSQKQNGGEFTFQFVDSRPEAIAQRKLQETVNNSPQVKQLRAFQEMVHNGRETKQVTPLEAMADNNSDSPIQKKPLNPGLLNVVGENHDTSDEFRTWESEYAKEKTGGSYWQENEFRNNVPKPGGKAEETASVFGDPKILQMANVIHFNTKALSDIIKFLTRVKKVKATKFNLAFSRTPVFGNLKLIQMHLPVLMAFGGLYKKLKPEALVELANRPDLKPICDFYIDFGDEFYDIFVAGVGRWATKTDALNKDEANEVELNSAVSTGVVFIPIGNALLTKIFEKADVPAHEHDQSKSAVILERSKQMHQAGTTGKASKGVWKIGNQHVADIKEDVLKDAKPEYELMTEIEFFEDFKKWLDQNPVYHGMKYGMEIADMYGWSERAVFEMAKAGEFDKMVESRKGRDAAPSYIS